MNPRFKYRRMQPRTDISEIKAKCQQDSVDMNYSGEHWNTTYGDDYIKHSNAKRDICPPPPVSISLGGGCLAPTREEMRSSYMAAYHPFARSDVPKLAIAPPNSEVIPKDKIPPVMSTAQEEMLNTGSARRSRVDVESSRLIADYHRSNHYSVGFDRTNYRTTTGDSFSPRRSAEQPVYENINIGCHIEFDKNAGPGPHTKSLSKRKTDIPIKKDSAVFDQKKKNFDIGYNNNDYSTTTESGFCKGRYNTVPDRCPPPPCAELSNHEPYVPKWRTRYQEEFRHRKPIPNNIDTTDLRKTHWDPGHEKNQWPVHEPPMSVKPERPNKDLQNSNIVFKGDGNMQFATTTGDMIGSYDKSKHTTATPFSEARKDHIFIGNDRTNYLSTAKQANERAGTGKPAQLVEDYGKRRGCAFAKGGDWEPYAGKDMVDIKRYKPVAPTVRQDGSYYKGTHFDLEATNEFKPRYSTTYYKTICKPTLLS